MKLLGTLKSLGNLLLKKAKENPKATALIVAGIVGGTTGAKIKKMAEKIPDFPVI